MLDLYHMLLGFYYILYIQGRILHITYHQEQDTFFSGDESSYLDFILHILQDSTYQES